MEASPPLRLSVEERVEQAVREAVRRALASQRRTQEEELDALSDVLQRSLAALAGERDRALRSLAAEEDRRRDMVEELSGLLGGELSCGDISRLAMGLERIEREPAAAGDEGGEPRGRAWVLEQLRQCLYARAAAQDHLRSSADEIAADMFEAEDGLMGFEPGGGGGGGQDATNNASPISCPPPADAHMTVWSAGSEGVARARAAASEALAKSLRLARERVEHLEALTAEVRGGRGKKRAVVSSRAAGLLPVPDEERKEEEEAARPTGEGVAPESALPPRREEKDDGVGETGAEDGAEGGTAVGATAEADGAGASSSDGSWSFPSSDQEGGGSGSGSGGTQAGGREEPAAAGDGVSAPAAAPADPPESGGVDTGEKADKPPEREEDSTTTENVGGDAGILAGAGETRRSAPEDEGTGTCTGTGTGTGGGVKAPPRPTGASTGASPASAASALEEAERWKVAARRSEASLADLRATLGDVLALSLQCGQESTRRGGEEAGSRERRRPCGDGVEAGGGGDRDGDAQGGVVVAKGGDVDGGGATERSGVFPESAAGVGGSDGSCCGRGRCSSCEAKAAAVEVLLKRLEALSVDQGGDIARLEASLRLPRRPGALSAVATAAGVPREVSGRAGVGGAGEEKSAAAAAALDAEGVAIAPLPSPASGSTAAAAATAAGGEGGERGASPGEGRDRERSRSRAASPPAEMRTEWEELEGLDTYLAHYRGGGGLGSQAVQGVLDQWIDVNKRNILEGWLGHVLHGGPVGAANGNFVPRVQMSSLSKEVRDGLVSVVLPLLLGRRGVLLQVLTRERVELVHDIQIRVTPIAGRRDGPHNAGGGSGRPASAAAAAAAAVAGRRRPPADEREHGARIRDMVMKAAHVGFVEEDEGRGGEDAAAWRTPLASVDSLSRQLKDTWENFNANLAAMGAEPVRTGEGGGRGGGGGGGGSMGHRRMLPEY